jgi:hypothetical protein
MSVQCEIQCDGCTQKFTVSLEIPAETEGTLDLNFRDQLAAPCPTCGREVVMPSGTYEIAGGKARRVSDDD